MIGTSISHYRILEKLGGGGMGVVYKATDTLLDRTVALKVLSPQLLSDPTAVAGFIREAKTASSLNHPNILTVHDLVEAEGIHFLVVEFVEGKTLREHIGKKALELRRLFDIAVGVADALAAAHRAGIVHRDLKPENVMIRADGLIKVVDFGLAKLFLTKELISTQAASLESTAPLGSPPGREREPAESAIAGTLPYMSPEQLTGKRVDHRTDIFSFGVVLYEMATGQQPHQGRTTQELIESILTRYPRPIADLSPAVPEKLQEMIAKALEKDPGERYQHMEDIAVDLRRLRRVTDSGEKLRLMPPAKLAPRGVAMAWLKRHQAGLWALAAATIVVAGVLSLWPTGPGVPKLVRPVQITHTRRAKLGALVTDGTRLYFSERRGTRSYLEQVAVAGGDVVQLQTSLRGPQILDISPDGSKLLVLNSESGQAAPGVWTVPVLGGSAGRVGDVQVRDAAWSPDGQTMAYAKDRDLYLAKPDGSDARKLYAAAGSFNGIRWSPDGTRLRFTLYDPQKNLNSLWGISADGANPRALLPGWKDAAEESYGQWTPDGKFFVFQSNWGGSDNVWALRERTGLFRRASSDPVQLTSGPMSFRTPAPSKDGKKVFAVGELRSGELVRYDPKTSQFASYLSGISAEQVDFSKDGAWVAYIAYPDGELWRSRVDGSEHLQLTFPPMHAVLPRWSPDGKQIVFGGHLPGEPWRTYLVSAEGGTPDPLRPEKKTEEGDAVWSPDGKRLALTRLPVVSETGPTILPGIQILDLNTKQASKIPDSDGLIFPRWSADGRYIAALSPYTRKLALFDLTTRKWSDLVTAQPGQAVGWPSWSKDSKYLYFSGSLEGAYSISRLQLSNHRIEQVVDLEQVPQALGTLSGWFGLAPDDSVLILRDTSIQEIYALEWEAK
jgi:Tol biopolymer transport system component